jgi:MYXO-CTERM domain-containing protein
MSSLRIVCFAIAAVSVSSIAHAQQIFSQGQLSAILGAGETMEDFEGAGMLPPGQIAISGGLDSSTIVGGSGPGLVKPGARYDSPFLFWNDNGYFGLNTRTLGDSSGWRGLGITITYTQPVTAMGFDMQGYSGYDMSGVVNVYDTSNNLISSTNVNGGFFGWDNAGGIGSVTINNYNGGYIMIDNHGYGMATPEPAPFAALGLGALAVLRRKRRG